MIRTLAASLAAAGLYDAGAAEVGALPAWARIALGAAPRPAAPNLATLIPRFTRRRGLDAAVITVPADDVVGRLPALVAGLVPNLIGMSCFPYALTRRTPSASTWPRPSSRSCVAPSMASSPSIPPSPTPSRRA